MYELLSENENNNIRGISLYDTEEITITSCNFLKLNKKKLTKKG